MKIIVILTLLICAFAVQAQDTTGIDPVNLEKNLPKALYVVDGIKIKADNPTGKTWGDVLNIPSEKITSITVLKGQDAIEKYGDDGKNGVILITTKPIQSLELLYIVDGVETKSIKGIEVIFNR